MASDIDSTSNEDPDLRLKWSGRWTLSHRILALNLITVLLVALSTLYLDVFRNTPFVVQLFFFYFGLPEIGIYVDALTTGVIALSLPPPPARRR